jgi:aryl-alcohol dehydrogenase-like predicted oxidoreductase
MDRSEFRPEYLNLPFTADEFHDMPYRWLGRTGLRVSPVGLGLWKFGVPATGDGARVDAAAAVEILDRAVELGVTFWDTANRYNAASGNSERVAGEWFRRNPGLRREVVLATKAFGLMDGRTPNHCRLSRINLLESVYASLERLGVDYVDLLYFHAFDPLTPPEESLAAVEDLVRMDLVRYFAVSNFTPDQIALYRALESSFSIRCRVAAVQNEFNILFGETPPYQGALDFAARTGVGFVAYSPLARGLLSGRYLDAARVGPGDRLYDEGTLAADASEPALARVRRLAALAGEWELEVSTLALAYTLTLPGMCAVIPGASSPRQLDANAAAGRLALSADQAGRVQRALAGPAAA